MGLSSSWEQSVVGKAGKEETWGCFSPFKSLSLPKFLIRPLYVEYILDCLFLYFKCLSQGKNASSELLVGGGVGYWTQEVVLLLILVTLLVLQNRK